MAQVVAVNHVAIKPLAEAEINMHFFAASNCVNVPSAALQIVRSRRHTVAGQDAPFFQVDVYRMQPSCRWQLVSDDPRFSGALLDRSVSAVRIEDQIVDVG